MPGQNIYKQLDKCMLVDVPRILRLIRKLKKADSKKKKQFDAQLRQGLEQSMTRVGQRRESLPAVSYPAELPIARKRNEILRAISENQVTIICGETGSGKTTQLPKICLQAGLGIRGKIGHTQPRRLAARAVSTRIAEELKVKLGEEVGFKVRFSDQSNDNSYIKLMTDGILLAECHSDPYLNQYDTIIIDEAHERSLNIDFILGYLKRLVKKRKDLKVIITSATIDPERFAKHFDDAPVINVSGRTYPVEVRYMPYRTAEDATNRDLQDGIIDAVLELSRIDRGDILIFLSGERDIRETADALNKVKDHRLMSQTEVLPLLARLSAAEQNRIFHSSSKRRIVLATNVAETSLTVPGIRYVIDSGVARISRYSWRSKIQRLPIEKISQASANQRKGRCGRVADGICIRLYEEEDFLLRDEFTEPEIKRTNLAAVILQMENLQLGHMEDFPFVEPPEERLINDGYRLLHELGAIKGDKYSGYQITKVGSLMARLPIDPRLARMLLEGEKENALNEVLIIVAALATQDPRERPLDKQQAADEKHAQFRDKQSDFIAYINLWNEYFANKKQLSGNQLRKWCKQNFISWLRMREWIDTHRQISQMIKDQGMKFGQHNADYDSIHRSLLVGLLGNLGLKDENKTYLAARNKKFNVFPGSALFKSPPKWIMSAEIVETSQVYARTNAKIDVQWVEQKAAHLLKHHYANPHWEKNRSQVVAHQQSTLYGLIIVTDKKVNFGRINPEASREIFIRSALIQGELKTSAEFYVHNQKILNELESQEAKTRRRDIVDEEMLFDFYDQYLPAEVHSGQTLEKWLRRHARTSQQLFLKREDLVDGNAALTSDSQFPDTLEMNGSRFPVEYHFDPNHHCDGITLVTPVAALASINPQRCEWLIPGLLHEKITEMIRALPKQTRKNFVPAPDYAQACVEALDPSDTALTTAVTQQLQKMTGIQVPYEEWGRREIAQHLVMNFRVVNSSGEILAQGRNLQQIKEEIGNDIEYDETESLAPEYGQQDIDENILDDMQQEVMLSFQGVEVKAYPALLSSKGQVDLVVLENRALADVETLKGIRQLLINNLGEQIRYLKSEVDGFKNLCLKYSDFGRCDDLKQCIVNNSIDEICKPEKIKTAEQFRDALVQGKADLYDRVNIWIKLVAEILDHSRAIKKQIKKPSLSQLDVVNDIQQQLATLFQKDFISTVPREWLQHYPRYLKAIYKRYEKSLSNAARDKQLRISFSKLWDEYRKRKQVLDKQHIHSQQLEYYRWMLEEYRVSVFAQEMKTQFPVSEKRLKAYWKDISDC